MGDIRQTIDTLADDAMGRCGQNYELYVDFFSADVDRFLASLGEEARNDAEQIARDHGYTDPSEREQYEWGENECIHHFDYDTCPLGCGDLDIADRPF